MLLAALLCCGNVHAQVPRQINYQGYLTNPGGAPVNATVAMEFNLYDAPIGAAPALYSETQTVTVSNGTFNVLIGSVTALPPALALAAIFARPIGGYLGTGFGTLLNALLLHDLTVGQPEVRQAWNGVSWSLSCEFCFYLAAPFLFRRLHDRPVQTIALTFAAFLVVLAAAAVAAEPDRGHPFTPVAMLVDYAHGWEPAPFWPNAFKNWHGHQDRFRFGDHERMLEEYFATAYYPIGPESEKPMSQFRRLHLLARPPRVVGHKRQEFSFVTDEIIAGRVILAIHLNQYGVIEWTHSVGPSPF